MFSGSKLSSLCVLLVGATFASQAAELKPEAARAWDAFVEAKQAQLQCNLPRLPESPEAAQLRNGSILVRPASAKATIGIPSGLIHEWVGEVFIPGISIEQALEKIRSYEDYPKYFKSSVGEAKLLDRQGGQDRYSLTLIQDVLRIRSGLLGEYVSEYHPVDPERFYSTTQSVRLQEITKLGRPTEDVLDPDEGSGFIWRLYSEAFYEEADGGIYVQLDAAALSRTVPRTVAWFVDPVVERISRSALCTTLRQTREALLAAR